ncbi:hypothetical protein BC749_10357 [Flavobacterium araucananum]|nr:hypothetical protein BC749_10357 [Flavobacterium araucananum]
MNNYNGYIKMKKIILLLGGIILFFIFRFFIIKVNNYSNINECNTSEYVADRDRIWIKLDSHFNNMNLKDIKVKISNNKESIYNTDSINKLNFYVDSKILLKDTLTISLKDKIYKIYDFKNGSRLAKSGQDRGNFHCGILKAKINGKSCDFYGYNEIYLDVEN